MQQRKHRVDEEKLHHAAYEGHAVAVVTGDPVGDVISPLAAQGKVLTPLAKPSPVGPGGGHQPSVTGRTDSNEGADIYGHKSELWLSPDGTEVQPWQCEHHTPHVQDAVTSEQGNTAVRHTHGCRIACMTRSWVAKCI